MRCTICKYPLTLVDGYCHECAVDELKRAKLDLVKAKADLRAVELALGEKCVEVEFYRTGTATSINRPLDTVTANDRFGLAMPTVELQGEKYLLDIRFRMLKAHELAAAQGFPKDYQFTGTTTEVVKQIGNAVPKNLTKALVKAALTKIP